MEDRKNRRADDGENRHGFRRPIDGGPPFLAQQTQDRRNERPSVTDTDPEHEVDDIPRPVDGISMAPHAHARGDEVDESGNREGRDDGGEAEAPPPPCGRRAFHDAANFFGDPMEITILLYEHGPRNNGGINLRENRRLRGVIS